MTANAPRLPIYDVLNDLSRALNAGPSCVLMAPPGAGKTTRVPLHLLGADWLGARKIVLLEPRRLAARNAAQRMAQTLGEKVGDTVGIRARFATKVGPRTRIEVVTEGVFTRMILDDPGLEGIGALLFDEFHERSLDSDLGLAFALECQRGLRNDLRILVMSATLDGARVAATLGNAPVVESLGRTYPVETRYLGRDPSVRLEDAMADAIMKALRSESGSVLAFLPGQGEIRRVEERLRDRLSDDSVILAPLYGALEAGAQDRAIASPPHGKRKIVLATSIAETSLTIEGVRVVVDCGLARVPRFEPGAALTRLETRRVSRASADQRRGRAGRTEPGVCYRLWDEAHTSSLVPFNDPEIRTADLAPMLLDCAEWGVTNPQTLTWLDTPTPSAISAAREELQSLGALDHDGRITPEGRQLRRLPLPPRLARMVIRGAANGAGREAAEIAALLVERGLGGNDASLEARLEHFRRDRGQRAADMRRLAQGWARLAEEGRRSGAKQGDASGFTPAQLLALAYPDRIAKARGAPGQFLLANGRGAEIDATDSLARARFLVIAEMQGKAARTRILLAAPANEPEIVCVAGGRIEEHEELIFDATAGAVRGRRSRRLDAIQLSSEVLRISPGDDVRRVLADGIAQYGIAKLPWTKPQLQLLDRIAFLRATLGEEWPDLSEDALRASVQDWLGPFLGGKTRLADITSDDLGLALDALIPWSLKRRLDEDAPTHFEAPTGNRHAIDYTGAGAPSLHIRVQELFGLKSHPTIARGRLPLTLHLLSPAHRPIQITRDLPGFWAGSWASVKADMKGHYPRHPWPDDPANALPTARAKPRGT